MRSVIVSHWRERGRECYDSTLLMSFNSKTLNVLNLRKMGHLRLRELVVPKGG